MNRNRFRLLYLNNRYRYYDRRKYELLSAHFDLTVVWINGFPAAEPLPDSLCGAFKFEIVAPGTERILTPWQPVQNLRLLGCLVRLGRDTDLLLSSTSETWKSKIAYLATRLCGKPIAFRKEKWFDTGPNFRGLRSLYWRAQDRLTRHIELHAAGMLVPGIKVRQHLLSRGIDAGKILPFHYLHDDLSRQPANEELERRLTNLRGGSTAFLYLGRILEQKGLDVLIAAFRRLSGEGIRLFVVGDAERSYSGRGEVSVPYLERCRRIAEGDQRILFFGAAKPEEVREFYQVCDVFVHPHQRRAGGREVFEGWGNVITEAASMSRAIVTTDRVPSAFDLVSQGRNGFIIPVDDLQSGLLEKLSFFVANPGTAAAFGRESRRLYETKIDPADNVRSIERCLERGDRSSSGRQP